MNQINQKLNSIVSLVNQLDARPKTFGTDVKLTGTDIHLIELIGDNTNAGVTGIAKLAGVTKGAVSQKLKQLEKKGIIAKAEDPENLSRSLVSLTSKGKVAYFAHKHWHETMDGGFNRYYNTLTKEKTETIEEFLGKLEKLLAGLLAVEK
ncbi:MarR family transcriptional regulator [Dethiosulfatarculus sandiegensis]|uniref:MarR family transcriptional regulator n=1 Tax=Dethiosulfatarculus sandiegensis TaxID=1429043 RepID=A0A0D2HV56_9BACT|nr:MarR family transcriptional regulator [Dethiosulfatarculus sandiegensis]